MSEVKIFWDPKGLTLESLGGKDCLRITDGDTPFVETSIRMLSIDTPEVHYPKEPSRYDDNLAQLAEWIQTGQVPMLNDGLAQHLQPKLATGTAGTLQEQQGGKATTKFQELLVDRLEKNPDGSKRKRKRKVFLRAADEHFDDHGRLLAYMAPSYTEKERASIPEKDRPTFNMLMVESGWAASFPIYPSLPKYSDLEILQKAAEGAFANKLGAWADPMALTGYEFRMCMKMYREIAKGKKPSPESWISRYCVDMTTGKIFSPQDYYKVKPYNRIFVWPKDVAEATEKLHLVAAD
jgi:endonuclease YncB( thermonuclease family)